MSLTLDNGVPQNGLMIGTELAYVREKLKRLSPSEMNELAKIVDVHPKTVRRISDRRTKAPRSDVIGKMAIHFRTQEKRRGV